MEEDGVQLAGKEFRAADLAGQGSTRGNNDSAPRRAGAWRCHSVRALRTPCCETRGKSDTGGSRASEAAARDARRRCENRRAGRKASRVRLPLSATQPAACVRDHAADHTCRHPLPVCDARQARGVAAAARRAAGIPGGDLLGWKSDSEAPVDSPFTPCALPIGAGSRVRQPAKGNEGQRRPSPRVASWYREPRKGSAGLFERRRWFR